MIKKNNSNFNSFLPVNILHGILLTTSKMKKMLPLNMGRLNKNYVLALIDSHVIHYPTPITLTYAWSFGSLAGICLVIQIISGVFLSMVRHVILF